MNLYVVVCTCIINICCWYGVFLCYEELNIVNFNAV